MDKNNKKNIISIEDRIPKLKEARKKKANRRLVFYLSIFFFLILIIVYLQSPLSQVKTIDINNNSYITDEEVIESTGILSNTNIWSIDLSDLEARLESNPVIKEASVERKLPRTVTIEITEKRIIALLEDDLKYFPVLENGEILRESAYSQYNGQAPLMIGFTDNEYLSKIASELNQLSDDILSLISEIHSLPEEANQPAVLLYMNDGFTVRAAMRDFAEGMSVYPSVVAQLDPEANGIIHVGVGVYFEDFIEEDENLDEEDVISNEAVETDAEEEDE